MNKKRIFTREDVSEIVRQRVNKLNSRIQELELELFITQFEKELDELARKENGN